MRTLDCQNNIKGEECMGERMTRCKYKLIPNRFWLRWFRGCEWSDHGSEFNRNKRMEVDTDRGENVYE